MVKIKLPRKQNTEKFVLQICLVDEVKNVYQFLLLSEYFFPRTMRELGFKTWNLVLLYNLKSYGESN